MGVVGKAVVVAVRGVGRLFAGIGLHAAPIPPDSDLELVDVVRGQKNGVRRSLVRVAGVPAHHKEALGDEDHGVINFADRGRGGGIFSRGGRAGWRGRDHAIAARLPAVLWAATQRPQGHTHQCKTQRAAPQNTTCDTALEISATAMDVMPIRPTPHEYPASTMGAYAYQRSGPKRFCK